MNFTFSSLTWINQLEPTPLTVSIEALKTMPRRLLLWKFSSGFRTSRLRNFVKYIILDGTKVKRRLTFMANTHQCRTYFAARNKPQVMLRICTNRYKPQSDTDIKCPCICYGHRNIKSTKFCIQVNGKYCCHATFSSNILIISINNTKFHINKDFLEW
jgi:hypothetical protein